MPQIFENIEQGSEKWYKIRAAVPTASNFSKIVSPAKFELSSQADEYANKLIAEILLKEPVMSAGTEWMERGKILENDALQAYEFAHDVKVKKVGFIMSDDGRFGCSPDFLVGGDGGGEIKCLSEAKHVGYLLSGEAAQEHSPQIQGGLWISERSYWDYCLFHHTALPPVYIRIYRDEEKIKKLAAAMEIFWDMMISKIEKLKAMGYLDNEVPETTILDAG